MGYSDQKYNTRQYNFYGAVDFGTATTGTVATTSVSARLPKFLRRTAINDIRLICFTIPNAAATALVAHVMNGTNTFGTAVLTTATAGQVIEFTPVTAANGTYAADGQVTIKVTGTATASADSLGDFDLYFETQELPA